MFAKIFRRIHHKSLHHNDASTFLRLGILSDLVHGPRIVQHLDLVVGTLVITGAFVSGGCMQVTVVVMSLLVHVDHGLLDVARTRSAEASGETKPVKEHNDPFGRIPIRESWSRSEVMRKSVL